MTRVTTRRIKGFTLIEVLITVAVLSTAIIFIFRSFATVLSAQKLSQDTILATFLAEEKIWQAIEEQKKSSLPLDFRTGLEQLKTGRFDWGCSFSDSGEPQLVKLQFNVSLPGKAAVEKRTRDFYTYVCTPGQ